MYHTQWLVAVSFPELEFALWCVCAAHMEYTEAGAHLKPDGHLPRQSPQLGRRSALCLAPPGTV